LWLFGKEGFVTEAGASNFFVIWRTKEGRVQLVTAGLENRTILEGITRKSILEIASYRKADVQKWDVDGEVLEPIEAVERDFSIGEIQEALVKGRLIAAFASGTAVCRRSHAYEFPKN
jgi:branched-chain amino acid aminotransferase